MEARGDQHLDLKGGAGKEEAVGPAGAGEAGRRHRVELGLWRRYDCPPPPRHPPLPSYSAAHWSSPLPNGGQGM